MKAVFICFAALAALHSLAGGAIFADWILDADWFGLADAGSGMRVFTSTLMLGASAFFTLVAGATGMLILDQREGVRA